MTATVADRGTRPVRIGSCSGFYGDRASALAEMAASGDVDVIMGDYLAEVTMLVLGKAREKDPAAGYATTFMRHLEAGLSDVVDRRVKVVVNAGGLHPAGLAAATRELVAARGLDLRVAHIVGDDLRARLPELQASEHTLSHLDTGEPLTSWKHQPLTANAYLGGFGIARALRAGADIVITGRVADASLVLGPAAWWWGWQPTDYDPLAGAIVAGHVIECGAQATGGNFSGFASIPDLVHPGFPIAELDRDGSSVITKAADTAGAVTVDTVTAQLLYEVGAPAYLNADVTTHLDSVVLSQLGPDRVGIAAVRGTPPPATTKVAVTGIGGWESTNVLALTGRHLGAKADLVQAAIRAGLPEPDELIVERIGAAVPDAETQSAATALLRVTARGSRETAGRGFSARLVELALSSYPGLYFLAPPSAGSACGEYWPGLIDQKLVDHVVCHHDGTRELVPAPRSGPTAQDPPPQDVPHAGSRIAVPALDPGRLDQERTVTVDLGTVALARSGDKGGDANLGVWVRSDRAWTWLSAYLTVEELRRLLPETAQLVIERHELPRLRAVNFVLRGLLGTGAASADRLDRQAKALGEWLLSRHVAVPADLVDQIS